MSIFTDLLKKFPKTRMMILTGAGAMIGYFGNYAFTEIESLGRQTATMAVRVEQLENDDAKWGTLAEQKKQLIDLAIEVEVLKRTWFHRQLDTNNEEIISHPPENYTPPTPSPVIKSPGEFRMEQSAKYQRRK